MAIDKKALALSKKYTDDTADALGAVKGAPCTIQSKTPIEDEGGKTIGTRIVFEWMGDSGQKRTETMDVLDGKDGKSAYEIAVDNGYEGTEEEWLKSLASGHTVMDADGTRYPQRKNLVFQNASVSDDAGKDATVVTPQGGGTDALLPAYIVGETAHAGDWLSLSDGGTALTPKKNQTYMVVSDGDYENQTCRWDGEKYALVGDGGNTQSITSAELAAMWGD